MSVSDQKGFTLLEILIAVVLLAFITFGVVSVTENAVNTKDRTTATNNNNLQIETAMSRFEWDFSQIYSPLYFSTIMNLQNNLNNPSSINPNFSGQQPGVNSGQQSGAQAAANNPYLQQYYEQLVTRFERNQHFSSVSKEGMPVPRFYAPEKNVFEFFTTSNRRKIENQKQSHFSWVRYQLADQVQTKEEEENSAIPKSLRSLVRYVSADDPYDDKRIDIENIDSVKGAVLLRNVESLEFQFWDFQKRKWDPTLRNIPEGENKIHGVKVIISWYDSTGNKRTTARIFRTHWPLVLHQDQTPMIQSGVQSGQQVGSNPGVQSGINGGMQ
jgi:prepilin-type N-terminal cleavage/methylation domain-containing protein